MTDIGTFKRQKNCQNDS